jgi:hypothetical protein
MQQELGLSSRHDFDFWIGHWQQRNWRLRERLAGCEEWDEYESNSVVWMTLDGLGNIDEYRTDYAGGYVGMSVRVFDPDSRTWGIYWADSRFPGLLEQPVIGSFSGGIGVFECRDTFDGRPIIVRYTWSQTDARTVAWEQAFSADDGSRRCPLMARSTGSAMS